MAKAAWCTVTPASGKENGVINISAAAHAGRDARNTTVVVTAVNGAKPSATIAVSQAGVGVKLTMDTTKPDLPGSGGTVVINGTSNSATLKPSPLPALVTGKLKIGSAADIALGSGASSEIIAIPGDPGASGVYNFTATLVFPHNPFPFEMQPFFDVTDSSGTKIRCQFKWMAGASSVSVSKSSLPLVNAGTAQAVNVTSNDDWTVS